MKEKPFATPAHDLVDGTPSTIVDHQKNKAVNDAIVDIDLHTILKPEHSQKLSLLFDKEFYCQEHKLGDIDKEVAWTHYLSVGMANNHSPNESIELGYIKQTLAEILERDIDDSENTIELWLEHGIETIPGASWFDTEFYLTHYPDIADAGQNAFFHYVTNGKREGRFPSSDALDRAQRAFDARTEVRTFQITNEATGENESQTLSIEHYKLLFSVFDSAYYCRKNALGALSSEEAWNHFLTTGLQNNCSINAAIDIKHLSQSLSEQSGKELNNSDIVLLLWLNHGAESIPGAAWFDTEFYLSHYPDIASTGINAFLHYANNGKNEGRIPNPYCLDLVNRSLTVNADARVNVLSLIESVPERFRTTFLSGIHEAELLELFMPSLYQAQRNSTDDVLPSLLLAHYLCHGWQEGHRPSVLWHEACYRLNVEQQLEHPNYLQPNYPIHGTRAAVGSVRRQPIDIDHDQAKDGSETVDSQDVSEANGSEGETDSRAEQSVFVSKPDTHNTIEDLRIEPEVNPYLHWFFTGRELNIIPSPLFDTELYCLYHPDILSVWEFYPFEHYLRHGLKDPRRMTSAMFNGSHYNYANEPESTDFPLLHYILYGQFKGYAPAPGIDCSYVPCREPLKSSAVEETSMHILRRVATLKEGVLADMISRAEALEPQIIRPYGERKVRMAPVFHPEVELMQEAREIVATLPGTDFDTIVLVPHIRMAGSARIAGKLTQVLNSLETSGRLLVVITDSEENERPDWFGENAEIVNISCIIEKAPQNRKIRALLDMLRGVKAKRVINLNSNLGWHLTSVYGRQLSEWMDIFVYLFCWDKDIRNNKGGYPIQWFLPTFDYCKAVVTDSEDLRDELRGRYCLTITRY